MKVYLIVNPHLEKLAQQEVKELINVEAEIKGTVLEAEVNEEKLTTLLEKCQSARRILVSFSEVKNFNKINFENLNLFEENKTLKIEVENVKGQENRLEIAKKVAAQLFKQLDKNLSLELKKPDYLIVVYSNEGNYFIGLDLAGEMNTREYRLFPHSATFKGDASYYIVRLSEYQKGEKLLVGYAKDGSLAIEAARYSGEEVKAFDESRQNITAARKNANIAKVNVNFQRYSLEELDTRFNKNEFDQVIFHITKKDEQHLNELYYQIKYILKSKGIAIFVTRPTWDLSISDAFTLVEKITLPIGESTHLLWKLKKK